MSQRFSAYLLVSLPPFWAKNVSGSTNIFTNLVKVPNALRFNLPAQPMALEAPKAPILVAIMSEASKKPIVIK